MSHFVLVATDGSPASIGALHLAAALAKEKGTRVEVLGVVEPVPVFDAGFMVALPEVELYESRQDSLRQEIEDQVEEVTGNRKGWPVTVEAGVPGTRIVKRAEDKGADAILMGIGRHRPVDRVFGTETVLQVIRVSHLPVLAVPQGVRTLPGSAAFAVDFSLFSQKAAQVALSLMQSPWEAHLVHVMSGMEFLPTMSEEWRTDYEGELREKLSEFAGELGTSGGDRIHLHTLEGEPSHELLAFSESRRVELLAAGSHGHSFVGPEPTEEVLSDSEAGGAKRPWVEALKTFTRNNAGRRTTLEVDDPELGFQECGKDFLLRGAAYDPKEDRIEIMLGPEGSVEGQLTHSILSPQEVQIERDKDGNARALRVRLKKGTISLRIHRD